MACKFFSAFFILLIVFSQQIFSENNNNDSLPLKTKPEVNLQTANLNIEKSILEPLQLNTTTESEGLNQYNFSRDSIPNYSDLIYEYRMSQLNSATPIQLEYNEVIRKYIDLFAIKRKAQISEVLGLSKLYFPIFEQVLDKYEMPLEIKYLAVIESGLNPIARSKSGAVGLWQLLLSTGKMFDLEITSYIDERSDVYKSTEAACKYLQYLYRTFGDWQLALAAYNGGPGAVKKAITRSGGKRNFWEIRQYLSKETRNYVPKFIAATYILNFSNEHNIVPKKVLISYNEIDTLMINHSATFAQISSYSGVSIEKLRFLNATYKKEYIPFFDKAMTLILPIDKIDEFLKYEKEIFGYKISEPVYTFASTENIIKTKIIHKVLKGEYFHKIALEHGCTSDDILKWNNLNSYNLFVGQQLTIWISKNESLQKKEPNYFYYTVQTGDSIVGIANKFKCTSVSELILSNNLANSHKIIPGKKLKIINSCQK